MNKHKPPFNIPTIPETVAKKADKHSNIYKQITLTLCCIIVIASGYYLIRIISSNLGTNIISIDQTTLIKISQIMLSQALILIGLSLIAILIKNPILNILTLILPPIILAAPPHSNYLTILLIPIAIICNSAFMYQIKVNTKLFIKFNIGHLIMPHTTLLFLSVALIIAIPTYQNTLQSTDEINNLISKNIITPLVKETIKSNTSQDVTTEFSAELLPPSLSQFVTPETLISSINQSQKPPEEISKIITDQIDQILTPYKNYIPLIITIIIVLTMYQLSKLLTIAYIITIWIVIEILKILAIAETKTIQMPAEIFELN